MSSTTQIKVLSPDGHSSCSLYPNYGGSLNSLVLGNKKILRDASNDAEYQQLTKDAFNGGQLFPFPNRIKGGKYAYAGQNYQLPLNDNAAPNSIHGLTYNRSFEIIEDEGESGRVIIQYRYQKDHPGYPYDMLIKNEFILTESSLEVITSVKNMGGIKAPIGHGWHPYFNGSGRVDECEVQLASSVCYEVDDQYIPTTQRQDYPFFEQKSSIKDAVIDSCFDLANGNGEVIFRNPIEGFEIAIETDGYPYLQAFIPPTRDCIALEPQTSVPDAFNNGIGLLELDPSEKKSFKMRITLKV